MDADPLGAESLPESTPELFPAATEPAPADESPRVREARRWRPRRLIAWILAPVLLVAALAGGWVAADRFQSPDQRAAAAAPPSPSQILVAVREGVLQQTTTAQTGVGPADVRKVGLPVGAGTRVVTANPVAVGAQLHDGAVVVEVSGRPVFAIPGAFPFYRDLTQGESGPDVRQLQDALRSLGYWIPTAENSQFGASTAAAVTKLYRNAGYGADLLTGGSGSGDGGTGQDGASSGGATSGGGSGADGSPATGNDPSGQSAAAPQAALVNVPLGDLLVVGGLPQALTAVPGVGTTLTGDNATLTLTSGQLQASSTVPVGMLSQVPDGAAATLAGPGGATLAATVHPVPPTDPSAQEGRLTYAVDGAIPADWQGQPVLATITTVTTGKSSLIVPRRAVIPGANGSLTVLRDAGDKDVSVAVTSLGTVGGEMAIVPTTAGALKSGDRVVVR